MLSFIRLSSLFISFCFCFFQLRAQQNQVFSQYLFNGLLTNPSCAGEKDKLSMGLFYRNQWLGMSRSPTIQSFSFQMPINYNRMGLAFQAINQTAFIERVTSASFAYAYKINVGKGKLSFGLEGGIIQGNLLLGNLKAKDQESELNTSNVILPDLSAGLFYQSRFWNIGISTKHLLADIGKFPSSSIRPLRHFYGFSSFKLKISSQLYALPSILIKSTSNIPVQADINLMLKYGEIFWLGGGYRTRSAFTGIAGVRLDQIFKSIRQEIRLGYAFDIPINSSQYIGLVSHELMLVLDFEIDKSPKQIKKSKPMISPIFF